MTAPKLRFKEFDGDWTLQNLGDSFSLISGYAFPSSSSVDVGARWLKIGWCFKKYAETKQVEF